MTMSSHTGTAVKRSAKQPSSYRYLRPFLKAEWPLFLRTFLFVLGYVATVPILPYLAGEASGAIGKGDVGQTAYWLGLAVVDFTFQNTFMYFARVSAIGKPIVQIAGEGPQFTYAFAEAQDRLLGLSVQTIGMRLKAVSLGCA